MQQEVRLQGKSTGTYNVALAAATRLRGMRRRVHPRARLAETHAGETWGPCGGIS